MKEKARATALFLRAWGSALLLLLLLFLWNVLKELAIFIFELVTNRVRLPWWLWWTIVLFSAAFTALVLIGKYAF